MEKKPLKNTENKRTKAENLTQVTGRDNGEHNGGETKQGIGEINQGRACDYGGGKKAKDWYEV